MSAEPFEPFRPSRSQLAGASWHLSEAVHAGETAVVVDAKLMRWLLDLAFAVEHTIAAEDQYIERGRGFEWLAIRAMFRS